MLPFFVPLLDVLCACSFQETDTWVVGLLIEFVIFASNNINAMKRTLLLFVVASFWCSVLLSQSDAVVRSQWYDWFDGRGVGIVDAPASSLTFKGYIRAGAGGNDRGGMQMGFQMPEAMSKYRLGNEADHYAEFTFLYHQAFGRKGDKSLDVVWTSSYHRNYGQPHGIDPTLAAEAYIKFNNLLGGNESFWLGRRYYDRKSIDMLDRYWLNPGQDGVGLGVENLLRRRDPNNREDLKLAAFIYHDDDMWYHDAIESEYQLYRVTADARWVGRRLGQSHSYFNVGASYTALPHGVGSDYTLLHGFGLQAWVDTEGALTHNTLAAVYRHGANIVANNSLGRAMKENVLQQHRVICDLKNAYSFELSNDFVYDNKESYALNVVALFSMMDYGTDPYLLKEDGTTHFIEGSQHQFYWFTLGARNVFYLTDQFRVNLELSSEYGIVQHYDTQGFLNKVTLMPEFAPFKGLGAAPVLRPFVTYAFWNDGLCGHIGAPSWGAGYDRQTSGCTFGLQVSAWW